MKVNKLLILTFILLVFGYLTVFSGVYKSADFVLFSRHLIISLIGIAFAFFIQRFNYQHMKNYYSLFIYLISICLLVVVIFFGKTVAGAKSWLSIGPFSFQPVEIAKLACIIYLANLFSKVELHQKFLVGLGVIAVPIILVLLQPDLGSALVFIPVFLVISYLGGVRTQTILKFVLFLVISLTLILVGNLFSNSIFSKAINQIPYNLLFCAGAIIFIFLIYFIVRIQGRKKCLKNFFYYCLVSLGGIFSSYLFNQFLDGYQKKRIVSFLNPQIDPLGIGYNTIQSKVAVGSGKFLGKGFLKGTQVQFGFLPKQHTDFVFSIWAEEFGFLGVLFLLLTYFLFLLEAIKISESCEDKFGYLLGWGIATLFFTHIFINIGMCIGIMPIVGIPLPLLSYGGTALICFLIGIGFLMSIERQNFFYAKEKWTKKY